MSHVWPPPGTEVVPLGFPERWVLVRGDPTSGDDGDWYVTTLGEIVLGSSSTAEQWLAAAGRAAAGLPGLPLSAAGQWPVIYEVGKSNFMRWIKSTFSGTIGGVETFQHAINWGKPGDDPDMSEAEALAFAGDLRAAWSDAAVHAVSSTGATLLSLMNPTVKYREVGVTVCTQTTGTAADGTGGNLEQEFTTQWSPYSVGVEPTGATPTPSLPYEVSCAVTLQTDHRGPSGRGRLYLPPFHTGMMGADGHWASSVMRCAGEAIGTLFDAITSTHDLVPVVVSRRRIILNEIRAVEVGTVPDSQRRRRRSQDEGRTAFWSAA